jgi:hypothetical protein
MSVATLLAEDRALPTRDALLDANLMAARLGEVLATDSPVDVQDYTQGRVKYRVGDSLRVLHRFRVDGHAQVVASRTFPAGESARVFAKAAQDASVGSLRAVGHDPELETVFWTFPHDRKLTTLPTLLGAGGDLDRLVGVPVVSTVVQYAPEKSATAACMARNGDAPIAFAKLYADADEARLAHLIYDHLPRMLNPTHPRLGLPGFVGAAKEQRLLVLEAVGGVRMDALVGGQLVAAVGQLGAAVATLHGLRPPDGIPRFARLDLDRSQTAAELIGRVRPDVADFAADLVEELAATYEPSNEPDACLHGDVHPKNGIMRDGRVVLIDLDQLSSGPSAAELGSVRAALRYRAVTGQARRGETARLEAAFLNGFGAVRSLPSGEQIRWHTAAALLNERALRAVNRIRPEGLEVLERLLEEARAELRGPA